MMGIQFKPDLYAYCISFAYVSKGSQKYDISNKQIQNFVTPNNKLILNLNLFSLKLFVCVLLCLKKQLCAINSLIQGPTVNLGVFFPLHFQGEKGPSGAPGAPGVRGPPVWNRSGTDLICSACRIVYVTLVQILKKTFNLTNLREVRVFSSI